MRSYLIAAASIAALTAASSAEAASPCRQDNTGRTVATIAGAGIGAVLGRVIDGGRHKEVGTIGGAIAGGLAGNQLAKGDSDNCNVAYGYYDENGRWHANRIAYEDARGYYDRDGRWVSGAPNGYYDQSGRWTSLDGDARYSGYRDRDGRWVPIGVTGYYAADGEWVSASAPGYYDAGGRWVAGPAAGYYDSRGRWIAESGRTSTPTGYWAARSAPGYYDENGRWVTGTVTGYYDARGRWVTTGMSARPGTIAYRNIDVRTRAARMEARIDRQRANGMISKREAQAARDELRRIRYQESQFRASGGRLTANEESIIQRRLDELGRQIRADRLDDDNRPG